MRSAQAGVELEMRNVRLHVDEGIILDISRLRGEMVSRCAKDTSRIRRSALRHVSAPAQRRNVDDHHEPAEPDEPPRLSYRRIPAEECDGRAGWSAAEDERYAAQSDRHSRVDLGKRVDDIRWTDAAARRIDQGRRDPRERIARSLRSQSGRRHGHQEPARRRRAGQRHRRRGRASPAAAGDRRAA